MSGSSDQQQPQAPPDLNAAIQALIQQQIAAASGQGQQVQLPSTTPPPSQYSNDPSQGPDLLARIGLAIGGGSLPGAPAALRQQMGKQALLNFGIGLLSAGRFSTPGEALAGGLRGAQSGLLGSEAAQAGQQEYALNAQAKMAELGMEQQKNRTAALTALVPLLQMQGRLGLPPLFGGGAGAGGPGGGGPGGGGADTQLTGDMAHDQPIIAQRESGGDPTALNYVAKADPTAYARGATASGKYQMVNSTWREALQLAGVDPNQYPTAMSAPEAVQDKAFQALYGKYGTRPWDASKFGANWVQQPGGGYQLVKGAQPPAGGPGSAVGPYKVASNAPVGPPGGDQPAPPAAASGLPEPPQPPAEGVPLPGSSGLRRYPDGTIGTPGQEGRPVITAAQAPGGQTAPPPDAQPTLGPVGPIPLPVVGAPPGVAPTPPPVSTQPPAAPAQPPVLPVRPPDVTARNDDGTYTVPDEKISTPQYQSRYRQAPTPDELVSRGLVLPENAKAFQDQQTAVQNAEAEAAAAHAAANRGAVGYQGFDVDKAIQAANTADKNAQDARNTYNGMVQEAAKTNAGAVRQFYTDQDAQLASAHKDLLDRQAAVALETQRGKQQIAQTDESQRISYINSQQGKLDEEAQKSRENLYQLDMLHGLSEASGSANPIGEMEVGGRSVRDWLLMSGIGTQSQVGQWTAQDAFKAGVTKFAQDMRAGQGMGRLTNQELTVMMQMLPNTGMDPGAREAIMDYMRQLYQRKTDFALHTANHLSDTDQNGKPISFSGAMNAADTELGPILPTVPKESSGSIDARDQWLRENVRPNTLFRQPNGKMAIYRGEAPAGGQ